jgi:mannose-6-phosphate isomerase-like protein (cupin superfamily)
MITLNVEKQGESITFLAEADTTAPRAEAEVRLAPGASGPPPHLHTKQHESFHVVSGRMIATVDGQQHTVEAGETLVVQPGQAHTFANASQTEPLIVRGTVEPALHFQWFLSEMAKSAIRAGGSWKDLPVFEAAYILHQMRDEYRLAGMPVLVQDIVFGLLARVAVLLGRTKHITPKHAAPARQAVR